MTYFTFLAGFICVPVLMLMSLNTWLARRKHTSSVPGGTRAFALSLLILSVLALVYTTPWDNYLVAHQVWSYNPGLVSGLVFGWVPLEEYTFFILQTILGGLWWWFLTRLLPEPEKFTPSGSTRFETLVATGLAWVVSAAVLFSGWKPGTYLAITLFWALPAIILQLAAGADILWRRRRLVGLAVLPVVCYLSFVDALAISSGTWKISPAFSTGLLIGRLPVEEVVFFLVTNLLISFGMTLMTSPLSRQRLSAWKTRLHKVGKSDRLVEQQD